MRVALVFFISFFLSSSMVACGRAPLPEHANATTNTTANGTTASTGNATIQPTAPAVQPSLLPAMPISADEAMMSRLQPIIGDLGARLTNDEKATFAGLWIEYTPNFRVVALFTRHGNETMQRYLPAELQGIVEVRSAETSLAELETIQDKTTKSIEGIGIPTNSDINVYENRVKVYLVDRARLDSAIKDNRIILSSKVDIITVNTLATPDMGGKQ